MSTSWRLSAVLAALVLSLPVLIVHAEAQSQGAVFASPSTIQRLRSDPWLDGVWIASEGGLFFKDMANGGLGHYSLAQGLPNAIVYDVDADPQRVWIGTGLGAAVLDKATQSVQAIRNPDGSPLHARVRTVFIEGDHGWLGTEGAGLYRVNGASLVATPVNNPVNSSAFTHHIYGIGSVGQDLYISATGYGLVEWDRATGEAKKIDYGYNHNTGAPMYGRILVTPKWVWIGTEFDGVIRVDRDGGKLYEYASKDSTNSPTVYIPLQVGDEVWMSTLVGVSRYTASTQRWMDWQYVPYDAGGQPVSDLAFHQGELYAATVQGRIARFDRSANAWLPADWWDSRQVMSGNLVNGCGTDGGHRLLFATGHHADYYDPRTNSWAIAGREPSDRGQPQDIFILATAADSRNRYFTHYNGVSELDVASGEYATYYVDGRTRNWGGRAVLDVEIDDKYAWFGMKSFQESGRFNRNPPWHPGMVTRMDRETHAMTHYGKENGLTESNVTAIESDGDLLWIGMGKGGLDVLDKRTGVVSHVYPTTGLAYVNDILVRPDAIWLAATTRGVVRIDRATHEATVVPLPAFATALADSAGSIWAGTYYGGLYAVDLATYRATQYGTGRPFDYNAYCLIAHDGLLYLGGDAGVQRFSLAERRFLPQVAAPASQASPPAPGSFRIEITSPPSGGATPDATLMVAGTSAGPEDSIVRVRAGDGAWEAASGTRSWSADVPLDGAADGDLVVTARLESGGQVLAQAARVVRVGKVSDASHTPGDVAVHHAPVFEAVVGSPIRFAAAVEPADAQGLAAHVELQRPGNSSVEIIPMVMQADGNLTGHAPPFTQAGAAKYRFVASWEGGSVRLPAPLSGFGDAYVMTVVRSGSPASAVASGPQRLDLQPGQSQDVDLTVQNVGVRAGVFNISVSGSAAAWARAPASVEIPAGESRQILLNVEVPTNATLEEHTLWLTLRPMASEDENLFHMTVNVGSGQVVDGQGTPLQLWLALVALAVTLATKRNHA